MISGRGDRRIFRYVPPPGAMSSRRRTRRPGAGRRGARRILLLAVLALAVVGFARTCRKESPMDAPKDAVHHDPAPDTETRPERLRFGYPTRQTRLLDVEDEAVYMPTGSGRVASALFGSTRTVQRSGRLVASFHEGIDIAPMSRDRRGRPLDDILAVADGHVGYINAVAGNSTYGIYVVLLHEDPVGTIYTLYAHLASAAGGLRAGDPVRRGQVIGRMGNTSTLGIPMQRAHLHFEIGTLMNRRFDRWFRAQGLTPDHGRFNGWNLRGFDPVDLYRGLAEDGTFSVLAWFRAAEPAFSVVVAANRPLDYFERHPALWAGPGAPGGAVVLYAQEGGLVLRGRPATAQETERLGGEAAAVLDVNEELLGRNGRRIVARQGGGWTLGRYGRQWIEKLTY